MTALTTMRSEPQPPTALIRLSPADRAGASLGVLERRPARSDRRLPPMLLVHGATFAAGVFDLALPGYSLMAEMARRGRTVYAVDIRGFGHSRMSDANGGARSFGEPAPSIAEAATDVGAAVQSVFDALWKIDPYVRPDSTAAFRCPCGPLADLVSVFNGRRLYDARKLAVPTLLVRGAGDSTSTDADAQSLLSEIGTAKKSCAVVPSASHFLLLEKGRKALYRALEAFFTPLPSPRRSVPENAL